jgi:hypothetical protein
VPQAPLPRTQPESVRSQHSAYVTNRDSGHVPEKPAAARSRELAQSDEAVCRWLLKSTFKARDRHRRTMQHSAEVSLVELQPVAQKIDADGPAGKLLCYVYSFLAHERHSTYFVRRLKWHFRGE